MVFDGAIGDLDASGPSVTDKAEAASNVKPEKKAPEEFKIEDVQLKADLIFLLSDLELEKLMSGERYFNEAQKKLEALNIEKHHFIVLDGEKYSLEEFISKFDSYKTKGLNSTLKSLVSGVELDRRFIGALGFREAFKKLEALNVGDEQKLKLETPIETGKKDTEEKEYSLSELKEIYNKYYK